VPSRVPAADPADAASVSASDDDVGDESFGTDFKLKEEEDLMKMTREAVDDAFDMERGAFLEGIHFAAPQDEKETKSKVKEFSKRPSAVISACPAIVTSRISDVSAVDERFGTNIDFEKSVLMMTQDNSGDSFALDVGASMAHEGFGAYFHAEPEGVSPLFQHDHTIQDNFEMQPESTTAAAAPPAAAVDDGNVLVSFFEPNLEDTLLFRRRDK
jgi:hypothetical protein